MKQLGTIRWVLHCAFRHRLQKVIEQRLTYDVCPCGYFWKG